MISWRGRIIGLLIGMVFGGPITMLIGWLLGYYFYDKPKQLTYRAYESTYRASNAFRQGNGSRDLVACTFALMGYVARGAGRINESHINLATRIMDFMRLDDQGRQSAMAAFNRGKSFDFDLQKELEKLKLAVGRNQNVISYLLEIQVQLALSDGVLEELEHTRLHEIAAGLGISYGAMEDLIRRREAQIRFQQFYQQYSQSQSGSYSGYGSYSRQEQSDGHYEEPAQKDKIANAYGVLGLKEGDDFSKVKSAYRQLMRKYHPDRMAAQGVPPEMARFYSDKAKDIQSAFDELKKHLS